MTTGSEHGEPAGSVQPSNARPGPDVPEKQDPARAPRTVTLRSLHDEDGSRHLSATLDEGGDLRFSGHDLGPGVTRFWGEGVDEYEWTHTVRARDVPRLVAALGGGPGADVLGLLQSPAAGENGAEIVSIMRAHGIPYEAWSWTSG